MKARKYFEQHRAAVLVGVVMALVLIVGLVIIIPLSFRGGQATQPIQTPTPTGTVVVTPTTQGETKPTPEPGVVLGPQSCPSGLDTLAHWDAILGTAGTDRKVESVTCASMMGNTSLQAVVLVRHSNADGTLDVYVFDKISSAKPAQIFKMAGLIKGDARISGYSTLMTAEVDKNSMLNAGKNSAQWSADLYREFQWNAGEGAWVQVAFPGIYPDLTRYQAEADQALVNKGQDTWKNDPAQVAKKLTVQFFQWDRAVTTKFTSGGGANDVYATVKVQESPLQGTSVGPYVYVTLSRLEGNTHNMWVAIAVEDNNTLTVENIDARSLIANPVNIQGKGSPFEAVIGNVYVLDHLYTDIGHAQVTALPTAKPGIAPYSVTFQYNTTFRDGVQEGIVYVTEDNGGISSGVSTAVMVKVLLTPEPGVVQGPVSCPSQIQKPGYWDSIIGIDKNTMSVGTLSCANMKGLPSLQVMVPVYHTDGSRIIDIYVYDNILAAHPVLLFKLAGLFQGGAGISGYSTLLTQEVDKNSTANSNKTDDFTVDLYREFVWSDGAGIFVQRAFPGFFPDLTRQQAELDQLLTVNLGKDPWKKDAAQVALRMTEQFFKWTDRAKTTVLSGGGSQDIDAVVLVKSPFPGNGAVKVTLSRLEGKTANMWVVVGVERSDGNLTITLPYKGDRVSNPATIKGVGAGFENVIGKAFVLDHLYNTIGGPTTVNGGGMGTGPYSVTVNYTSTFKGGMQEGIVAVYQYSNADGSIASATLVKVMLEP